MQFITSSKLFNYLQCPHRVWRDVHGPKREKEERVNPFLKLLWEKGMLHEEEIVKSLGKFVDLRGGSLSARVKRTIKAMESAAPLIYQGVLKKGNLLGIPDLLEWQKNGGYIPLEIKSGMGYKKADSESDVRGKLKREYAIQLCLYAELLEKFGFLSEKRGVVIDISKNRVEYPLCETPDRGKRESCWELYLEVKKELEELLLNRKQNRPALAGFCKLCPWDKSCKKWCRETNDLTRIFQLGRSRRESINYDLEIYKLSDLAEIDVDNLMEKKKRDSLFLHGIGRKTLASLKTRADIFQNTKAPRFYKALRFPNVSHELFFDIEDDPTQELVYLHGIYQRSGKEEQFFDFTACDASKKAEKMAWKEFWNYIKSFPKGSFALYYYSSHEKTAYKKLAEKYPRVISKKEVEVFFDMPNVIDLYSIIVRYSDWPVSSYSIKSLANYLGFKWRDKDPSGALSIEWYNKYLETGNSKILDRILEYNEDDCKAMMVLKDALENLS